MHDYIKTLKKQIETDFNIELRLVVGDVKFGVFKDLNDNPIHYTMRGWKMDFPKIPIMNKEYPPYLVNILYINNNSE